MPQQPSSLRVDPQHGRFREAAVGDRDLDRDEAPQLSQWRTLWAEHSQEMSQRVQRIESCLDALSGGIERQSGRFCLLPSPLASFASRD